jgi:hypothetical protein
VTARHRRALLAGDPQVVVSEQVVENAMVLRNIPPEASTVLDFGAVESMLPMTLAAPGRRVTVWDRRPYAFAHPLLSVVPQDLLSETPPGLGTFDIVISVPTIEHLGLDSYGDVVMDNADSSGGRRAVVAGADRRPPHRHFAGGPRRGTSRLPRVRSRPTAAGVPSSRVGHYFRKRGGDGVWERVGAADVENLADEAPAEPLPVDAVAVLVLDKR